MVRSLHLWAVSMSAIALAGCVTTRHIPPPPATDDASWRVVLRPGTTRYHLALGEVSSGATPVQRIAPIYPPGLLGTCPAPVDVRALLIVDQAGKVSEVRIADERRTDPYRQRFIDAVRVAARQWRFSPLQIDRWAANASGNSHVVDSETRPFTLGYVFRFECHTGKPFVSTEASGAAHS